MSSNAHGEGEQLGREQRADMEEEKDRNNCMKIRFRKWMGLLKKGIIRQERGFPDTVRRLIV